MKLADKLRAATGFDPLGIEQSAQEAAALLDDCENAISRLLGLIPAGTDATGELLVLRRLKGEV